jgi:ABC transporter, permease protein
MIYRLLLVFVLKLNVIQANDFKLVSALLIALFLSVPELKKFSLKLGKGDK